MGRDLRNAPLLIEPEDGRSESRDRASRRSQHHASMERTRDVDAVMSRQSIVDLIAPRSRNGIRVGDEFLEC